MFVFGGLPTMPALAMPVAPIIALGLCGTLAQGLAMSDRLRWYALMSDVSLPSLGQLQ